MKPVKSSNISAIGYDAETKTLTVQFSSGGKHSYAGVPPETHQAMMSAESIGKYFHAKIRNTFRSTKAAANRSYHVQSPRDAWQ